MGRLYELAYRFGVTPWEQTDPESEFLRQLRGLLDQESAAVSMPATALDLGCGTGDHSIELAQRGWQVTGLDSVERAVQKARVKAYAAHVDAEFLQADVTNLPEAIGAGYRLVLDVGCYHGLAPHDRTAYAQQVTSVTDPGASLLMFAFSPGRRGPLPRGADRTEIEQTFSGWRVVEDELADTGGLAEPIKRTGPRWFRLTREDSGR
ncbi:class I SAM-dependent methyltransferase [Mycobacterium sp. CBMA271]|uniref:class I SAM-dependent methyltransferase n=1 Tax=unclassified Mycobacteroides TaxID=2618759 RepID=UPI0012DFB516|nr:MULTISPECIES: class I SAM-dependent methyltransferase [unclassified Mycobacteroides]MUM17588.1 SAM-dependent methyltransferase [Mycobacteroides sp. CBMA 326]MUM24617.1 class I SAM-dependent methyltransferase [Mycobacteroides sp. CBMA 271]